MKKLLKIVSIFVLIAFVIGGYAFHKVVLADNLVDNKAGQHTLYIRSNWNYDSLKTGLYPLLKNKKTFDLLADRMNLPNRVIPGKYVLKNNLGNRGIIKKLRAGDYEEVRVVLKGDIRRKEIFGKIAQSLEVDSIELQNLMNNSQFLDSIGYNTDNWPCLFVANTYHFNWATNARSVVKRFLKERELFWTDERKAKAEKLGLSPNEVVVLASIVDGEAMHDSELKTIAGLYLNRLKINMMLQADPTVKFVAFQEGRQRVLNVDLQSPSPYNTYKYVGLPPGPVLFPSNKAIDAVLNPELNDYIFMCAKADWTGYHWFEPQSGYNKHLQHRADYGRALDERGIRE
ncbi:MAG: endolytic transglycosylase MltG [Flavobacteriales bacterium]|nr:endolytic transglycosylase MltG [Flavobacteriales bacterium]